MAAAATTATTTARLKFQALTSSTTKPNRRHRRETTITASAISQPEPDTSKSDPPNVVSLENSWCCPAASKPPLPPTRSPPPQINPPSPSTSGPPLLMDPAATVYNGSNGDLFSKFNSALTAGLLNPMSPPPSTHIEKSRSSPTLIEMMVNESDCAPRSQNTAFNYPTPTSQIDRKTLIQQRLYDLVSCKSPNNQFNDSASSDVKLTLSSKEGFSICISVHRQILISSSRFFSTKLSDQSSKQQRITNPSPGHCAIEIADCDDIEVYIETLRLMYCKDLRRKLMKEDVSKVLGILKVSAAVGFNAGVLSCLEYLEAAPWAEDEEEKVASLLTELRLGGVATGEVLKRVSVDAYAKTEDQNDNEEVLLKLLHVVLEGKDEKARREMKGLVSKMLRENASQSDLRKESLYFACDGCLKLLRDHFLRAAEGDLKEAGQIARQADNLHWILDILIDRQIADGFMRIWASQSELSDVHSKVPAIHRHEISRVTARLFVGVGKGQLLASKEARCLLIETWLAPFYEDFGWMRRAAKGLDRHLIEEGLSNTILTLPLSWQQEIFMSWFDRFLNGGSDCPNMQRGFEVWWRRAFRRRNGKHPEQPGPVRILNDVS